MKKVAIWMVLSLLVLSVPGCGAGSSRSREELTIAVAASLTDVIQEVGERFVAERHVTLIYNFAASGALARQLLASPRADLFLSASERWMDEVDWESVRAEPQRRAVGATALDLDA